MKKLLFVLFFLTSCATYKIGQTPDDLYFSGNKEEIVFTEISQQKYQEYISPSDERFLRMKIHNRNRYDLIDDFGYWNDFRFHSYYGTFNPYFDQFWYNPFFGNRFFSPIIFGYNPYIFPVVVYKQKQNNNNFNSLFAQRNKVYNNSNTYSQPDNYKKTISTPSSTFDRPSRNFNSTIGVSSSAGGLSGGFNSQGSSASTPRGGRN